MPAEDQVLEGVEAIRKFSSQAAEYIDGHFEAVAAILREQLSSATWLPDAVRPRPPPPPPSPFPLPLPSASSLERLEDWLWRHRLLTGLAVLATGTVLFRTYRRSRYCRKVRRARRARNNGRMEVVVVAGKPSLPLTKSLALDLERRGHIVYVVCNSAEDEALVQHLSRPDVKPLSIDITDPPSAGASIERFAQYLQHPHAPVQRAKANYLSLKAVILVPSIAYQTSPIATIPPSSFADLFNTHLLHPILTIQAFLPLLTSRLAAPPASAPTATSTPLSTSTSRPPQSSETPKVIVFTPSVISSINPPFHAPEATVCSALSAFTEVLTAELRPLAIRVTHVQLGTFDLSGFTPSAAAGAAASARALLMPAPSSDEAWPEHARQVYGHNFGAQSRSALASGTVVAGLRGTPLRELHHAVFDILDGSNTATVVRVGLGANLYGFVGRWFPRSLVSWMMGVRRVDDKAVWRPTSASSADEDSAHSGSDNGDFIAVSGAPQMSSLTSDDANVWRTSAL